MYMKDHRDGSPDKPFYQNILDKKQRKSAPKKPSRGASKPDSTGLDSEGGKRPYPGSKDRAGGAGRMGGTGRGAGVGRGDRDFAPRGDHGDRSPRGPRRPFTAPETGDPVFAGLSPETRSLLEGFPELVQSVMPLDSRKLHGLAGEIRELSHELTDERSERRVGYMNEPPVLSAYIRYFMWWNLVRLTRLFSGLPLELEDGDAAVDLGSGPLTLPIALWMSRPDLRAKKLTWYCVDLSQNALSAGEELLLSLAAKTGHEPWQIVRIKGEFGASLRRRVRLVASANMFNELFWDDPDPIEAQAKRHAKGLASYAEDDAAILLVEPGVPLAGRFVSLMRDSLLRLGFRPVSPCPHEVTCPLPGLRGGKWCHFVFDTADAPKALHKLSEDAGLSKDRAALSFVFAQRTAAVPVAETVDAENAENAVDAAAEPLPREAEGASALSRVSQLAGRFGSLPVRVASDPIRLPGYRTGRYGCSEIGLTLVTGGGPSGHWLNDIGDGSSGTLLRLPRPPVKNPPRDEKTGAILIELDDGYRPAPRDPEPDSRGPKGDRRPGPRGAPGDSRRPRPASREGGYDRRGEKGERPFGKRPPSPRRGDKK